MDIPITAAKHIADTYDYDQVIIIARKWGRNWKPKHMCYCPDCGWRGKRAMTTKPCPKCGSRMVAREAGIRD